MNKAKRSLFNFWLGTITCVLLIGLSTVPSWSKTLSNRLVQSGDVPSFSTSQVAQPTQVQNPINQHLMADLQEAESVLTAQGMSGSSLQLYAAILTKNNVVPKAPSTMATGVAGAALAGNRLIVRGDFGGLSSALRDYETDPVDPPNPNITSAAHIHRGEPNQNGPFQYALTVMLNDTGMGGRLSGAYTLTPEQLQALSNGQLYVDIHTKQNRAGELRGIFRPL
ncbi:MULTISPECIES: CHRD domain-containing protein [Trichocoleus]|uniref:CHRD domain-containing protein n=1 Tax=Trichocoleus desertorum GB2-A4 TaxID=2933944 RepID=A0ABV0JH61_9CYAN|nr:CHRD domain-containing protein [Trichocoleus sp. FACHB-46]MBD1864992.1 CHRD domain-containing protein [Trichocoleus sp. FACHB-46]